VLEIELKARVADLGEVERTVAGFARFVRRFDKLDSYWHGPDWRFARGTKGFRIRSDEGSSIVTFKRKRNEGGIEINDETEFEVSDREAFLTLVRRVGCEPFYEKRKTGTHYEFEGFIIELVSVQGLGDFIEIERVIPGDEDPAMVAMIQGELKAVLARSGVPESSIEGRSYSELILGQQPRDPAPP
jgi:adenylate cyclase class 2